MDCYWDRNYLYANFRGTKVTLPAPDSLLSYTVGSVHPYGTILAPTKSAPNDNITTSSAVPKTTYFSTVFEETVAAVEAARLDGRHPRIL